jgi:hypothetical protein
VDAPAKRTPSLIVGHGEVSRQLLLHQGRHLQVRCLRDSVLSLFLSTASQLPSSVAGLLDQNIWNPSISDPQWEVRNISLGSRGIFELRFTANLLLVLFATF